MRTLVAYSACNSPGLHDATGAFIPEAKAFARLHAAPDAMLLPVDCRSEVYPRIGRREMFLASLGDLSRRLEERFQLVGFFCHGSANSIQFGFDLGSVSRLAQALARCCTDDVRVVLYCCSVADVEGSNADVSRMSSAQIAAESNRDFADAMRDALCRAGAVNCQVDGHERRGHTTQNPYVLRFLGSGCATGGIGGGWLVAPGSVYWHDWQAALKTEGCDLRLRFPVMNSAQIVEELAVLKRADDDTQPDRPSKP